MIRPVDATAPGFPTLVVVTGPSGAGRSLAINALEDLGFESIDNMPMSLIPRLMEGPPLSRPVALGVDTRTRDFSAEGLLSLLETLREGQGIEAELLFIDCDTDTLVRRYSETRRRHPLGPDEPPLSGILREQGMIDLLRRRADVLVDTSHLTPHELRREIGAAYDRGKGAPMTLSVQSFSYKRGLPRGADMVFDCRFLSNPHWQPDLRPMDGRQPTVAEFVEADPRFAPFYDRVCGLVLSLLDAFVAEGKSSLTIAFGCTGGKHRSVVTAEKLSKTLAEAGWRVSKRHREIERGAGEAFASEQG